jgi:hypothetical protein
MRLTSGGTAFMLLQKEMGIAKRIRKHYEKINYSGNVMDISSV